MIEVWRGGVNTWECDEMGHMNVRFYAARAAEGLAGLARALALPRAFAAGATSTLVSSDHHIRFLKEARAGAPLAIAAGVLEHEEAGASVVLSMTHADGAPAAAFVVRVEHATPEGRFFPWPSRAREALAALATPLPDHAAPRGVSSAPVRTQAAMARADALGLACVGRGVVRPQDVDVFGRLRLDEVIGRVSDGVPALLAPVRRALEVGQGSGASPGRRIGGAVVEYRLAQHERATVGDHLELRSGLVEAAGKTLRLVHWLLDPVSGRPWMTMEALAVNFDLDTRKAVAPDGAALALLQERLKPGLAI